MKKKYFIFLLFSSSIFAQYTLIPDPQFEQTLINYGYDSYPIDGKVLKSNINKITELDLYYKNIISLSGIEDFTALRTLYCGSNKLTNLDLSKNLELSSLSCERNFLNNLDLSKNIVLTKLYCIENQISNLNIAQNTSLTELNCSFNKLTNIDITGCTSLQKIICNNNQLNNLNTSNNFEITSIECSNNQIINIDISENVKLIQLSAGNNFLNNLDITNNPALLFILCSDNQLTILDLTNNAKLTDLYCSSNQLTNLDISNNTFLSNLRCFDNQITNLDITHNNYLKDLLCYNNKIISLDTSQNLLLRILYCQNNLITSLNVSMNDNLEIFSCYNNHLTYLNLRNIKSINWWNDVSIWVNNPELKCIHVPNANFFNIYYSNRKDDTANYIDEPIFEKPVQTICSKQNATLNDIILNRYNTKWFDALIGGNELPESTPLIEGSTYYAMNTAGDCESLKIPIKITLQPISPPIAISPQSICNMEYPTLLNLDVSGNELLWYSEMSGGNVISTSTTLINGNTYYVSQSNNGCESSRASILVNIHNTNLPTVNSPQTFCIQQNPTISDIIITAQNVKWYNTLTNGNNLLETTSLQNNTTYYVSQTINGCESERVPVLINIQNTPVPTANTNQSFCSDSNSTVANIQITGNQTKWYDALINGFLLAETTNLVNGETYYASQTVNNCESERLAVNISIVNTPATPTANGNPSFCKNENATLNNVQISGQKIKWYENNFSAASLPNSTLLEDHKTYYASQTIGCESDRIPILIRVYNTPLPIGNKNQQFCMDENATIANLTITPSNIKWYDELNNGTVLTETTLLQNGKTYYATQTLNNCESERLAITVKIQDTPIPIANSPQIFCIQKNAKISNIAISGQNINWFESASSSIHVSESTLLENGIIYYASQTINNCEGDRIPIAITILGTTTADCINFIDELPYPKFFTPNNDGHNDTWTIDFAYLKSNTGIRIFDRYGKLLKVLVPNTTWNGQFNNQQLPATDYWFIVTKANGQEYKGHFSLKR